MRDRLRGQRGTVLPSPVVVLSVLAVAFAAVAYFLTQGGDPEERVIDQAAADSSETATAEPSDETTKGQQQPKKKQPPPVRRGEVPVVVFNNTGITGLASTVSATVEEVGWKVVGADNWYGTIPATTVYHGPKMKRAANQLALDLGVERVLPAADQMSNDRLTLILTGELDPDPPTRAEVLVRRGGVHDWLKAWSSRLPRQNIATPHWCVRRRRPWSGSTSTAPSRPSSRTPRGHRSTTRPAGCCSTCRRRLPASP